MKRILSLVILLIFIPIHSIQAKETIVGSGKIVSENRPLLNIKNVEINSPGILIITQGESESLRIDADNNLLPYIMSQSQNGTLKIGLKDISFTTKKPLHFYLTLKNLEYLGLSGSANVTLQDFKGYKLNLKMSGTGDVSADLECQKLILSIAGSGSIQAKGTVHSQEIEIMGSGDFKGGKLKGQLATVSIMGKGTAEVNVSNHLELNIAGSGNIKYHDDPEIIQNIMGSGRIKKVH